MALYQNGILISGANKLPQMTYAEWQALPASERPSDWICTDRSYSDLPASDVAYDNTESGLTAETVQDAIDEVAQGGGGGSYTAGDGIDITDDEISVDTTFTEASTRANIASGESFKTILGKIKKFFTDLKAVAFSGSYSDLTNTPNLATVATSGSYNDLTNKPTIPTDFVSKANGGTFNGTVIVDLQNGNADNNDAWSSIQIGNNIPKGTAKHSTGYIRLYGHGSNYTEIYPTNLSANRNAVLPDKSGTIALTSDIPTVNNAILTIQKNGTNIKKFSANSSTDVTANITVPTKLSRSLLTETYGVGSWNVNVDISGYTVLLFELTWYGSPFGTMLWFKSGSEPRVNSFVGDVTYWASGKCTISGNKITEITTAGHSVVSNTYMGFKVYGLSLS